MEQLPLPEKYLIKKISKHQADIIIEPFFPGYGTTIGNALRRVLLSSLEGAAVTAFKIKGGTHEFSSLPGIKEDLVEIILNLKTLRFKLQDNVSESRVTLKVKGEKKVKGKDIKTSNEVEIINPEADIATLTDKEAELEMELIIKTGRGYIPVENVEKKKFELGTIAIDSIFSPIKNVNFDVESVRVGQMTNYDRLIMSISTDGTITPDEALRLSASMLVDHFSKLTEFGTKTDIKPPIPEKIEVPKETHQEPIAEEKQPSEEKPKKKRGRPKKVN